MNILMILGLSFWFTSAGVLCFTGYNKRNTHPIIRQSKYWIVILGIAALLMFAASFTLPK